MLVDRLNRFIAKSFIGLVVWFCSFGVAVAADQGDAVREVIDSLHNKLFEVASDSTLTFDNRSDKLAPVVGTSYDFEFIGRFILRRAWRKLEPTQRDEFVSAFQQLSVANYASRFAEIDEQELVITDVRPATGERMQVDAKLQTENHNLVLSYTLKKGEDNNWAIINVIADGVSDLALRRAEYSKVLKDKGFDGLLGHIDDQITNLN